MKGVKGVKRARLSGGTDSSGSEVRGKAAQEQEEPRGAARPGGGTKLGPFSLSWVDSQHAHTHLL